METNWKEVKHFKQSEFACRCGCGLSNPDPELVRMLDKARGISGCAYRITSASRCEKHNAEVSDCKNPEDSPHLKGLAADIACSDSFARIRIVIGLILAGFRRIGISKLHVHVDAESGKPWALWIYWGKY